MGTKPTRRFFTQHSKSSAMLVSLIIHAVLIVMALSFVAVTVISKDDLTFEAKPVNRPKMALKKLQVPVNIKKKKTQKPKLRKRIVVLPKMNQTMPDIKMPEITGVKGGLGSAGDGLGVGGGVGFSMPEINIFGLKSRGEKVFLVLNCGPEMMADSRGGIPAYTLIKNELISIIDNLPPTTLINISVYSREQTELLFPTMVSATPDHVAKARIWLSPLNQFTVGMGNRDYGTQTLGAGGGSSREALALPPLYSNHHWLQSALIAMKQNADSIYVLTGGWGNQTYVTGTREAGKWSDSDQKKWEAAVKKANAMFAEENQQRRKKGLPPKVMSSNLAIVNHYVPDARRPPGNKKRHYYTPEEIEEGMIAVREKYEGKGGHDLRSGIHKKKDRFSFNVIHFSTKENNAPIDNFKKLTNDLRGKYIRLEGLEAIQFKATYSPDVTVATEPR